MKPLRCAVYTRKSTEDGLEQEFNSLHAQREACEAYIMSQRHEGWSLVPNSYDDGGFSGGNMDRPGLRALMADVDAGLVDVIVVYKVDRLTRSLADFAKIVERLDAKQASFVSVTQAFNTTTSMGRLTLNVLLSFAQFEREVTGERIRDKIAASKKKGMWMGGLLPLGYDRVDKQLVVNDDEADRVRHLYQRYLDYPLAHRGRLDAALAQSWNTPALNGRHYAVLAPRGFADFRLRFVQSPAVAEYAPFRHFGWNAAEFLVQDVDALAQRLLRACAAPPPWSRRAPARRRRARRCAAGSV